MTPANYFWEEDKYQAGSVYILDVANLKGRYSINDLQPYTTFEGDEVLNFFFKIHLYLKGVCKIRLAN